MKRIAVVVLIILLSVFANAEAGKNEFEPINIFKFLDDYNQQLDMISQYSNKDYSINALDKSLMTYTVVGNSVFLPEGTFMLNSDYSIFSAYFDLYNHSNTDALDRMLIRNCIAFSLMEQISLSDGTNIFNDNIANIIFDMSFMSKMEFDKSYELYDGHYNWIAKKAKFGSSWYITLYAMPKQ